MTSMTEEQRQWVANSCPQSLGPTLYISCVQREIAALRGSKSVPQSQPLQSQLQEQERLQQQLKEQLELNKKLQQQLNQEIQQSQSTTTLPALPGRRVGRSGSAGSHNTYTIDVANNDELFIINDEKYEAQTYCLGWEEGDEVMFLEGDAFGTCASAKLLNMRTHETCEVWCE